MKRVLMGVALMFLAHAACGAIQYEFFQNSRSDSDHNAASDFNARAVVDGKRFRVEFISGSAYPPGTYVISTDGAQKLRFVDPSQKAYTEVNTVSIAAAIGSSNIKVENLQHSILKLEDHPQIAGIPTDHYRLTITYEITVTAKNLPLRQSVRTTIDKWTTVLFGDSADAAFSSHMLQTGNAKLDEIMLAESSNIKGFPLKQSVQTILINVNRKQVAGSNLKLPSTQTLTREMTVTSIGEVKADEKSFVIPAGYRQTTFEDAVSKTQTTVLSMEPAS